MEPISAEATLLREWISQRLRMEHISLYVGVPIGPERVKECVRCIAQEFLHRLITRHGYIRDRYSVVAFHEAKGILL